MKKCGPKGPSKYKTGVKVGDSTVVRLEGRRAILRCKCRREWKLERAYLSNLMTTGKPILCRKCRPSRKADKPTPRVMEMIRLRRKNASTREIATTIGVSQQAVHTAINFWKARGVV